MKRHKWKVGGPYEREFRPLAAEWDRLWRNWPCGVCGLWKRAKVHR